MRIMRIVILDFDNDNDGDNNFGLSSSQKNPADDDLENANQLMVMMILRIMRTNVRIIGD